MIITSRPGCKIIGLGSADRAILLFINMYLNKGKSNKLKHKRIYLAYLVYVSIISSGAASLKLALEPE